MLEFDRLIEITIATGTVFLFQIYVIYIWSTMLPRQLLGWVFRAFQPAEPSTMEPRIFIWRGIAVLLVIIATLTWDRDLLPTWIYIIIITLIAIGLIPAFTHRILRECFSWTFYAKHIKFLKQKEEQGEVFVPRTITVLGTVFNEKIPTLHASLGGLRVTLEEVAVPLCLGAVVDGYSKPKFIPHADKSADEIRQYCEIVVKGNAGNKRANLEALYLLAEKYWADRGYENPLRDPRDIIIFHDTDTRPKNKRMTVELLKPFADPTVGIVTTAQSIYDPRTWWQHVCNMFEWLRRFSSKAALSLFGWILCAPGRNYACRGSLLSREAMRALVDHTFTYFGWGRWRCVAGDDRFITDHILSQDAKGLMAPQAEAETSAPEGIREGSSQQIRWGRSSQYSPFEHSNKKWFWRMPFRAFVAWTDILNTIFTVFMVCYWLYQALFGDAEIPLIQALLISVIGMTLTMMIRQLPLLKHQRQFWLIVPFFAPIGMYILFLRMWSLLTMHKMGRWETRGAEGVLVENPTFTIYHWRDA